MDFDFVCHIMVAFLLGAFIGFERQMGQHPAGLRTNTLVALGASMFVSVSLLGEHTRDDAIKIAGQIITGIGFLGGGVIIRDGFNVHGINTAATLWCAAAVGTLCGFGHYWEAIFSTSVIVTTNLFLRPISDKIESMVKRAPKEDKK
jgi:putative Mg2+ transporter-C (MgtC) family protein